MGLGDTIASFNLSMINAYNATGAGVSCLDFRGKLADFNLTDGMSASIQVITTSTSGASLFNVSPLFPPVSLNYPVTTTVVVWFIYVVWASLSRCAPGDGIPC